MITRLACALGFAIAALLPAVSAAAGSAPQATSACDVSLPPVLGGCGANSPYTANMQAGVWGMGSASAGVAHGWVQMLNTGPDMPHLVIRVDSRKSFKVSRPFAQFNTVAGKYTRNARWMGPHGSPFLWDFGRFPAGSVVTIRFHMRLTNRCSYNMAVQSFGNTGTRSGVDPNSRIWGGDQGVGGSYGPCP